MQQSDDALAALEFEAGVRSEVTDGLGRTRVAPDDLRCAVLRALGFPVAEPSDAASVLGEVRSADERRSVPAVLVAWGGRMEVPSTAPEGTSWTISSTDPVDPGIETHRARRRRGVVERGTISVEDLDPGFHELVVGDASAPTPAAPTLVIAAPDRAITPSAPFAWGVRTPVDPALARAAGSTALAEIEVSARSAARLGASAIELDGADNLGPQARSSVADRVARAGLGLYVHLPLASNDDDGGLLVGLPPEPSHPDGQTWGNAGLHAEPAGAIHAWRRRLEERMVGAAWLQIDHVARLEQLYVTGGEPTEGVLVRQPTDQLLAVLCLLSNRHGCALVGDDTGSSSPELVAALGGRGVFRRHVAVHEPLARPGAGVVATIASGTSAGLTEWWNGDDIERRRESGGDPEVVAARHDDRESVRSDLAGRAHARADLGPVPPPVAHQLVERLGHGDTPLVLVDHPGDPSLTDDVLSSLDRARRERADAAAWPPPGWWFGADEQHLFNEGTHGRLWHVLGARPDRVDGADGVRFGVWAPDAASVHVIGDHTGWSHPGTPLRRIGASGVWDGFVDLLPLGSRYKYRIGTAAGTVLEKTDPLAFLIEQPPGNASIVADLSHEWSDGTWMQQRSSSPTWSSPMSIYEVHLGSWRRHADGSSLSYREHADELVDHVATMGFTHVELLPITEHPLFSSWGYQTTGYFAATSRYGSPTELMHLVDRLHEAGVGVILDWVPSHFPTDAFGLATFDGTHLYEHADPREGFHPDWKSSIFNYGRHEVRSFLISSARFWLEAFHVDGLRVDAVASMLYRDYSRGDDWIPNRYGGRENLEAVSFLQQLNHEVYAAHPDVTVIAEESTAWPGVTRSTDQGGLGFGFKWDMGWMNDTLAYFAEDPLNRRYHHDKLTFRAMYGFSENYVLPLSHDEVVHGKGSLLAKMPGAEWERFANLRLLFGWQYATPGKKLVFMGSELAPTTEWNHDEGLPWHLADDSMHQGVLQWVAALNRLHREHPALHRADTEPAGFRWIDADNGEESLFSFVRSDGTDRPEGAVVVVMNATPVPRTGVELGVPHAGEWEVLASSDDDRYGGSGAAPPPVATFEADRHGYGQAVAVDLPGLSITFLGRRTG